MGWVEVRRLVGWMKLKALDRSSESEWVDRHIKCDMFCVT